MLMLVLGDGLGSGPGVGFVVFLHEIRPIAIVAAVITASTMCFIIGFFG